jgi:hypothetical protein
VLDDNCGPAYSVVAADLTGAGNGQPTHLLVTSHECLYDHRMLGDVPAPGGLVEGVEEISVGNRAGGSSGGGALFAYEIPQKWRVYPRVYPRWATQCFLVVAFVLSNVQAQCVRQCACCLSL